MAPRRKVFVSYHHRGDRGYYDNFVNIFAGTYQIVHDHSVEREIGSENPDYVIRRIRENYLTGASVTIVLCGKNTWGRKYVDWEILASLNQEMGLIAINLPTNPKNDNGKYLVPDRLFDNTESGYALFRSWNSVRDDPPALSRFIEAALSKDKALINNGRAKRLRDASLN